MKKVISFSLWGNIRLYCIGAIKNALLAKKYFPGWVCRYYYDTSVPDIIIDYLKNLDNVELFFINIPSGGKYYKDIGQYGMFWRFYPFNDDDVEIWMARDIDSRISEFEAKKIYEFLETDKVLHTFSNSNEKICRGCGISFRNYIGNNTNTRIINDIQLNIHNLLKNQDKINCKFYDDENFLNNILFPYYKKSYLRTERTPRDKSLFNELTGNFIGHVLDEYDCPIDKNKDTNFNFKNNYDDLYILINDYKNKLNII